MEHAKKKDVCAAFYPVNAKGDVMFLVWSHVVENETFFEL